MHTEGLAVCHKLQIARFHTLVPFNTFQLEERDDNNAAAVQNKIIEL